MFCYHRRGVTIFLPVVNLLSVPLSSPHPDRTRSEACIAADIAVDFRSESANRSEMHRIAKVILKS